MTPLFMWAGGKTKLLEHYAPFLPESFDSYHEPFFGGAEPYQPVCYKHSLVKEIQWK